MTGGRKGGGRRQPADGLGGLVGGGPSQVGLSGSMRARDVSRPGADDLARAERTVVLRRRPFDPDTGRVGDPATSATSATPAPAEAAEASEAAPTGGLSEPPGPPARTP